MERKRSQLWVPECCETESSGGGRTLPLLAGQGTDLLVLVRTRLRLWRISMLIHASSLGSYLLFSRARTRPPLFVFALEFVARDTPARLPVGPAPPGECLGGSLLLALGVLVLPDGGARNAKVILLFWRVFPLFAGAGCRRSDGGSTGLCFVAGRGGGRRTWHRGSGGGGGRRRRRRRQMHDRGKRRGAAGKLGGRRAGLKGLGWWRS